MLILALYPNLLNVSKLQKGFYYLRGYFVLSNMLGVPTLIFHFMGFVVGFLLGFMVKEKAR